MKTIKVLEDDFFAKHDQLKESGSLLVRVVRVSGSEEGGYYLVTYKEGKE